MSIILDTNVISEVMRKEPSASVLEWMAEQTEDSLYLSVITLGELRRGALLLASGKRRKALLQWIDSVVRVDLAERILPVDEVVIEHWARLHADARKQGRPLGVQDGLIAATATAHDFQLATRNIADFKLTKVRLINPWSA